MKPVPEIPCVLIFSGLDPTGGAGLQADQEALFSMGCHPCPIVTTLSAQDTSNVHAQYPVSPEVLQAQFQTLVRDVAIAGVKIGLVPNAAVADKIADLLRTLPDVPVVMDPVLTATGGARLTDEDQLQALIRLLPQVTLLTPNRSEARRLTRRNGIDEQARELIRLGCKLALITGGDADTERVHNHLYAQSGLLEIHAWARLPGPFHGTGCTLSAAVCGLLAQGQAPAEAVAAAQRYTWETLCKAYAIGRGQPIPDRLSWARRDDPENAPLAVP